MLEESHIYFRNAADILGLPSKLRDILKNSTSRSAIFRSPTKVLATLAASPRS